MSNYSINIYNIVSVAIANNISLQCIYAASYLHIRTNQTGQSLVTTHRRLVEQPFVYTIHNRIYKYSFVLFIFGMYNYGQDIPISLSDIMTHIDYWQILTTPLLSKQKSKDISGEFWVYDCLEPKR